MSEVELKVEIENKYGENIVWFLEDYSCGDANDVESAFHEVYGEDVDGREGSCEINTLELAGQAAKVLNELLVQRDQLRQKLEAAEARADKAEAAIREAREQKPFGYIPNVESTQKWLSEGYTATLNPEKEGRYIFPVYAAPVPAMPIQDEPIAWMNNQGETTINEIQVEYWRRGGYEITPLYAHPPIPADHSDTGKVIFADLVERVTKAILFQDCGSTEGWEENTDIGTAALKAICGDWKIVPTTVTKEMRINAWEAAHKLSPNIKNTLDILWEQLLNASPQSEVKPS